LICAPAATACAGDSRAFSDADAAAGAFDTLCGAPVDARHAATLAAEREPTSSQCAVLSNDAIENDTLARGMSPPNTAAAVSFTALAATAKSLSETVADWSRSITTDTAGPTGH
jgi:hypothetical protein